jgi:hypothetical protein
MQITCYLAAAVFSLFTYWQFNDLEQYGTRFWYGWVVAYGATALIAAVSARRAFPRVLYLGCAALAFVATAIRVRSIDWSGTIFYNEANPAGNETGGLLIVGLWFTFLAIKRLSVSAPGAQ